MTLSSLPLAQAVASYDTSARAEDVQNAQRQRKELVARFPISRWETLALSDYALGGGEKTNNTFSWWIEWGTADAGSISGGSSYKHLMFWRREAQEWYFPKQYANYQEAWEAIRTGFLEVFHLAQIGEWDAVDDIEALSGAQAVRMKVLSCYFPDDVLPIHSTEHIRHFLEVIGVDTSDLKDYRRIVKRNRALLHAIRSVPGTESWSNDTIMYFLYDWARPIADRRIIKVAPGHQGSEWEACAAGGYICVGWDDVGDLSLFPDFDSFRTAFAEHTDYGGDAGQTTRKAKELWTLRELEPGDIIVANRGVSEILGIGEVVSPGYQWRPEREAYKHTATVKWSSTEPRKVSDLPESWRMTTVAKVSPSLFHRIATSASLQVAPEITNTPPLEVREIMEALERKGQVILYGPPGTGKTYHALQFRQWWLNQSHQDATAIRALRSDRRTWFMVANPKIWRWETLFENGHEMFSLGRIQRNFAQIKPGDLVLGYQANPVKRIVALARVRALTGDPTEPIDIEPLRRIADGPTYDDLSTDEILKLSEPVRHRCQGTLFALTDSESDHLLSLIADRDPDFDVAAGEPVALRQDYVVEQITFHPSYSYEDFIEGYRPVPNRTGAGLELTLKDGVFKRICTEARLNPSSKYLFVIDEINRANVPKVFGEIITLLERDKRGLEIRLPMSNEYFQVPANVYILGTMNTADKSIRLLDAALRRRFAFIEYMPDSEHLAGARLGDLDLGELLDFLNRRILEKEGREKQIGHAFFMEDGRPIAEFGDFARRFHQEVSPLLQEYCYDDFSELAQFVGAEIVDLEAQAISSEALRDPERLVEMLSTHITKVSGSD